MKAFYLYHEKLGEEVDLFRVMTIYQESPWR